jgi:hypothetical protein
MQVNEQVVRKFAHQIWESEGKPEGQANRHWEMACLLAEGKTGPADPLEPLTSPRVSTTSTAAKTPKASPASPPVALLTGPAEHEVTMTVAKPDITPPPARVRVKAVIDDPAAAPRQKLSSKNKTREH